MKLLKNEITISVSSYAAIVVLGFLLYFKVLFFELTYLDDNVWIVDHHWFLRDIGNALQMFTSPDLISGVFYRPLLNLSFMFNALWGGNDPFAYHLTNIVLHTANGCLLFFLLKKLGYQKILAFSFSLILIVHPVLTQAVAWIPGRTDSLLAFFTLLSFIFYVQFLEKGGGQWFLVHLLFFVAALLVKETAIAIAMICFLYAWLILRQKKVFIKQIPNIVTWAVVAGIWFIVRYLVLVDSPKIRLSTTFQSILENSPAIISYIGKIFFPVNLSVLPVLEDLPLMYGLISISIIAVLVIISKTRRWRCVLFGLIWFFLFLTPSLVLSFLKHEYRVYLPMIGFMFILPEINIFKWLASNARNAVIVFGVLIGVLFLTAYRHADNFKERMVFWNNAVSTSPHSPLAHRNLGAMYYLNGDSDAAEVEYKKSLELNPYEPMVYNNLGLIYVQRNQLEKAAEAYLNEIAVNPDYGNVYFNLGSLYYAQGYKEEAVELWKKTIELNSKYLQAYQNLLFHYLQTGDAVSAQYYVKQLRDKGVSIPAEIDQAIESIWQR